MTIQYTMLVALGFLIASFIVLLVAPAFWSRAVRLTSRRLRESMPATEGEIRADKDKLRAEFAIKLYRLESQVEQAKLGAARQLIELNRRDANISDLETKLSAATAALEENQNARRVLEQTITERLPRVEAHLEEAQRLIAARDQDIAQLTASARRQQEALSEARAIVDKQSSENDRLTNALMAYEAGTRRTGQRDADFDSQIALKTELEAARARLRDQSAMVDRLQAEISAGRLNTAEMLKRDGDSRSAHEITLLLTKAEEQSTHIERLKQEVREAQAALKAAREAPAAPAPAPAEPSAEQQALARELANLKAHAEDQSAEIVRLTAELAAVAKAGDQKPALLKDNRLSLKSKVSGLEAKSEEQGRTIQRLRVELAAANERAARQSLQLREEMRKAGMAPHVLAAGTRAQAPGAKKPALGSVMERAAQVLRSARGEDEQRAAAPAEGGASASGESRATPPANARARDAGETGGGANGKHAPAAPAEDDNQVVFLPAAADRRDKACSEPAAAAPPAKTQAADAAPRRSRLLERLSSFGKA